MKIFKLLILLSVLILFSKGSHAHKLSPSDFQLSKNFKIKLYENFPLNHPNPSIERVVIVVHGIARNADEYFDYTQGAAQLEGLEDQVLILAPHFKVESDPRESNELYWRDSWKFGDLSANGNFSSYDILDRIIENIGLSGKFPALKKIILIGHSAGGQVIARYAAGSPIIDRYPLQISYVISNPSSYLYFSPERFNQKNGFVIPEVNCPDYHSYPYGIRETNSYMGHTGPEELQVRFNHRKVTLLLGESDTLSDYLDTSCEANLQGKDRFERGLNYYKFIKTFYPESYLQLKTVPNIGHSGREMIQSKPGRELLFRL